TTTTFKTSHTMRKSPNPSACSGATDSEEPSLKPFSNLHRVCGCAFADLVSSDKQLDPTSILAADVLPDPAGQHVVLMAGLERHREMVGHPVIDNSYARCLRQDRPDFLWCDGALEFKVDRLAVRSRNRDAHAGCRHEDLRVAEDLARLLNHLVFFFVVAILRHFRVMTKEIVHNLMRKQ